MLENIEGKLDENNGNKTALQSLELNKNPLEIILTDRKEFVGNMTTLNHYPLPPPLLLHNHTINNTNKEIIKPNHHHHEHCYS